MKEGKVLTVKKKVIMMVALIGAFLTVLDTGILYTGTVELAAQLSLTPSQLSWVQMGYVLTYAGFMLLGGKLGDMYGRKNFFIISLLLFATGSLAVGLSVNAPMIITFRTIQGRGTSKGDWVLCSRHWSWCGSWDCFWRFLCSVCFMAAWFCNQCSASFDNGSCCGEGFIEPSKENRRT